MGKRRIDLNDDDKNSICVAKKQECPSREGNVVCNIDFDGNNCLVNTHVTCYDGTFPQDWLNEEVELP